MAVTSRLSQFTLICVTVPYCHLKGARVELPLFLVSCDRLAVLGAKIGADHHPRGKQLRHVKPFSRRVSAAETLSIPFHTSLPLLFLSNLFGEVVACLATTLDNG